MNKVKTLYALLLTATMILLASCSTESSIYGLWQDTNAAGTIEFKTNGEVIIVDNTSATVMGNFSLTEKDVVTFELTATDIMSDSIQPTEKRIVTAKITKLNDDELQLGFAEETDIENYRRLH